MLCGRLRRGHGAEGDGHEGGGAQPLQQPGHEDLLGVGGGGGEEHAQAAQHRPAHEEELASPAVGEAGQDGGEDHLRQRLGGADDADGEGVRPAVGGRPGRTARRPPRQRRPTRSSAVPRRRAAVERSRESRSPCSISATAAADIGIGVGHRARPAGAARGTVPATLRNRSRGVIIRGRSGAGHPGAALCPYNAVTSTGTAGAPAGPVVGSETDTAPPRVRLPGMRLRGACRTWRWAASSD